MESFTTIWDSSTGGALDAKCMLIMLVVCGMHANYLLAGLNEITLLGKKWKRRIAYGRGIGVELSM
jgi:hypothetical protein